MTSIRGILRSSQDGGSTASYAVIRGPMVDAWVHYRKLMKAVLDHRPQYDLAVLSLGPTATAMAYDLCREGMQALDLGHLGMFYAHIHPKARYYKGGSDDLPV